MLRAEKLIKIIKTAKLSSDVNEPPVWQIEKLRFQSIVCRVLLLPVCGSIAGLFRFMQGYRIENMAEIRREFKKIWAEKERTGKPLVICANHLTFIDSALMIWALASNFWYLFNYRAFMWNVPAGDFFKK
jgi:1-acyl-sn-glycerol-3-phosphate acyltransferase